MDKPTRIEPREVALLPCPFCGGDAEAAWIDNDQPLALVSCQECPAIIEIYGKHWSRAQNEAEAVAAWNTRAILQESDRG